MQTLTVGGPGAKSGRITINTPSFQDGDVYSITLKPKALPLTVLSPNGGEQFEVGQSAELPIRWSALCTTGPSFTAALYKSGTLVHTMSRSTPARSCMQGQATTTYSVSGRIPVTLSAGTDYTARVSVARDPTIFDESDKPFVIAARKKGTTNAKTLFLSSQTYTGNLGGLPGADAKCQALANTQSSLKNKTFKAWLSDPKTAVKDRLALAKIPYALTDGTIIADNWEDLTDGALATIPSLDEAGKSVSTNTSVWTNTSASGAITATRLQRTCWDWTASTRYGAGGSAVSTAASWTDSGLLYCGGAVRLYCVEQ